MESGDMTDPSHLGGSSMNFRALIQGGRQAPQGRFPYMVSIKTVTTRIHKCGGVLIDPQYVLTAAHCIAHVGDFPLIHIGPYGINEDESAPAVEVMRGQMCPHPNWNGEIEDGFDIALAKLRNPVKNAICPDLLPGRNFYWPNSHVTALGWGMKGPKDIPSKFLKIAENLLVVDNQHCPNVTEGLSKDHMFCTYSDDENTCEGDSGGPILLPDSGNSSIEQGNPRYDVIIGIISMGKCEMNKTNPALHTDVSSFHQWINETISSGECALQDPMWEQDGNGILSILEGTYVIAILIAAATAILSILYVMAHWQLMWDGRRTGTRATTPPAERSIPNDPPHNSYGNLSDKAGQFLGTLADWFNTSKQGILDENPDIVAAGDIKPGDIIRIPNLRGGRGLAVIRAWKDEYTVQDGDTLQRIANQFTTRVRAIKKVNPSIPDTDEIRRGQIIRIPPADGSGLCALQANKNKHVVRKGDNLSLIAEWYGTSVNAIKYANTDVKDPNLIFPRQVLYIP